MKFELLLLVSVVVFNGCGVAPEPDWLVGIMYLSWKLQLVLGGAVQEAEGEGEGGGSEGRERGEGESY